MFQWLVRWNFSFENFKVVFIEGSFYTVVIMGVLVEVGGRRSNGNCFKKRERK
jgi:hypothetical protein